MGALKIDCYCNEKQMTDLVKAVTSHLYNSDRSEISDFDDVINGVRVCVEFDTYMDTVQLKVSEILDEDWDLLYEDSAVLTSRLRSVVNEYNRNERDACEQSRAISSDRYTS
jgi:hypothetical protein